MAKTKRREIKKTKTLGKIAKYPLSMYEKEVFCIEGAGFAVDVVQPDNNYVKSLIEAFSAYSKESPDNPDNVISDNKNDSLIFVFDEKGREALRIHAKSHEVNVRLNSIIIEQCIDANGDYQEVSNFLKDNFSFKTPPSKAYIPTNLLITYYKSGGSQFKGLIIKEGHDSRYEGLFAPLMPTYKQHINPRKNALSINDDISVKGLNIPHLEMFKQEKRTIHDRAFIAHIVNPEDKYVKRIIYNIRMTYAVEDHHYPSGPHMFIFVFDNEGQETLRIRAADYISYVTIANIIEDCCSSHLDASELFSDKFKLKCIPDGMYIPRNLLLKLYRVSNDHFDGITIKENYNELFHSSDLASESTDLHAFNPEKDTFEACHK